MNFCTFYKNLLMPQLNRRRCWFQLKGKKGGKCLNCLQVGPPCRSLSPPSFSLAPQCGTGAMTTASPWLPLLLPRCGPPCDDKRPPPCALLLLPPPLLTAPTLTLTALQPAAANADESPVNQATPHSPELSLRTTSASSSSRGHPFVLGGPQSPESSRPPPLWPLLRRGPPRRLRPPPASSSA